MKKVINLGKFEVLTPHKKTTDVQLYITIFFCLRIIPLLDNDRLGLLISILTTLISLARLWLLRQIRNNFFKRLKVISQQLSKRIQNLNYLFRNTPSHLCKYILLFQNLLDIINILFLTSLTFYSLIKVCNFNIIYYHYFLYLFLTMK